MGARSFDDEFAQVPSRDGADRYFAPNINILLSDLCVLQGIKDSKYSSVQYWQVFFFPCLSHLHTV